MNNLIDVRQVITQVLGFLIMLWILRRFAWGPVLGMLEARRQKIAGEFQDAANRKAEADQMKSRYEQELRGIEAQSRARMQEGIAEGQKVAAEIREQAQRDAQHRMAAADEEIHREREKSKELVKEQVVRLAMRTAEKILRQRLDDGTQRQLVSEFINEVGAQR
jgi:F-type H+-transporting ATPase subunit b